MNGLHTAVADYLALRNGLGHDLADAARLLPRFAAWMQQTGQSTVTVVAALDWCQQPDAAPGSVVWSRRMTAVRGFARYLAGIDPATEVPPRGLLPWRQRWRPPFIYTSADIGALLEAARTMASPRRAVTYETLFGLLAATGMRVGEAIRLDRSDIDWPQGVVLIRQSKFGKSRLVPLHTSSIVALRDYADRRAEFRPRPGNDSFFLSLTGRRLIYVSVHEVFDELRTRAGLGAGSKTRPRIHDYADLLVMPTWTASGWSA